MPFSGSQKRKLLLYFTLLVTAMFGSDGVLDSSVLVTATQESRHLLTCRKAKHSSLFIPAAVLASPEGALRASLTAPLKSSVFVSSSPESWQHAFQGSAGCHLRLSCHAGTPRAQAKTC